MPMQAAEKRRLEQENLRKERIRGIIECSFGLFAENGIENISMSEIAEQSEIGVASLYRYFSTKEDLAIEVAIYAWNLELKFFSELFDSEQYKTLSGFEQMKALLEVFEEAIISQRSFFSYIYYFDSFVKKEKIVPSRLEKYEQVISSVNNIMINALDKGKKDGSITLGGGRNDVIASASDEEIYFTLLHSLFCLGQKLSISAELLAMDRAVEPNKQIRLLVNIMLESLR